MSGNKYLKQVIKSQQKIIKFIFNYLYLEDKTIDR